MRSFDELVVTEEVETEEVEARMYICPFGGWGSDATQRPEGAGFCDARPFTTSSNNQHSKQHRVPQSEKRKCLQSKSKLPEETGTSKQHIVADKCEENKIFNKSKLKRIRRKEKKKEVSFKMLGNNENGLLCKLRSLEHVLSVEKPAAVFLQETKLKRLGRTKTPSSSKYTWYELHCTDQADKGQSGGGLALGVLNVLEPSWVSEGDDDAEAITVKIWVEGFPIRLVCAYGPQESDKKREDN